MSWHYIQIESSPRTLDIGNINHPRPCLTRSPEKVHTFTPLLWPLLSSPASTPLCPSLSLSSTNLRREGFPSSPSITDENSLDSYMASYSTWESSQAGANFTLDESGFQTSQSVLWGGARVLLNPSGRLDCNPQATGGRQVYCLSSHSPCSPGSGEKEARVDQASTAVLSQRLGIDPLDLVGWNESLRVWLTQTVLRPLVAEVDSVNSAQARGGGLCRGQGARGEAAEGGGYPRRGPAPLAPGGGAALPQGLLRPDLPRLQAAAAG